MTEWLDLMLEEVRRKRREAEEAQAEQERREAEPAAGQPAEESSSK